MGFCVRHTFLAAEDSATPVDQGASMDKHAWLTAVSILDLKRAEGRVVFEVHMSC